MMTARRQSLLGHVYVSHLQACDPQDADQKRILGVYNNLYSRLIEFPDYKIVEQWDKHTSGYPATNSRKNQIYNLWHSLIYFIDYLVIPII